MRKLSPNNQKLHAVKTPRRRSAKGCKPSPSSAAAAPLDAAAPSI
jgi:hypothetical protein